MTINSTKAVIQSHWEHSSRETRTASSATRELKQKHQELTVKAPPVSALFLNTEVALKGRTETENTGSV